MIEAFYLSIITFIVGLFTGAYITDHGWKRNAYEIVRKECDGNLYKVINLSSLKSWRCFDYHLDDRKTAQRDR